MGFSESFSKAKKQKRSETNSKLRSLIEKGLWRDIEKFYTQIKPINLKQKKQHVQTLFNKAASAAQSGRLTDSALLHCELIGIEPDYAEGLRNGAIVMRWIGAYEMAMSWIKRYVDLKPECPEGHNTLGTVFNDIGKSKEAFLCYKKALTIKPNYGEAHSNIANIYHINGDIDNAYIHSSHALALMPNNRSIILDHLIYSRRACALDDIERINWFTLATSMPSHSLRNIFLQTLVSCASDDDSPKQFKILEKWSNGLSRDGKGDECIKETYLKKLLKRNHIKIGFISGDFRNHSVARFIWPLFKYLPRNKVRLYGYSTTAWSQEWGMHFEDVGEVLADVSKCDQSELCEIIRNDELNVLVDLTGFTKGSRTGALANRCAPVQITWLGYPGTTSVNEIDYIFTDSFQAPTSEALVSEKLLVSNGTSVCIENLPEVNIGKELPSTIRGYITFGSLNNPYKFNRETLKAWAEIMMQSNGSKILLIRREYSSFLLRENIRCVMAKYGVDPDRIIFFDNRFAKRNYLDCYNEIDISLDTYPVTGGTTTIDSLWMGVPVVSMEGNSIHQRISSAILRHAGCSELIANNYAEFTQIALSLCQDINQRIYLRSTLREQLKTSELCNVDKFTKDFYEAIESTWISLTNKIN